MEREGLKREEAPGFVSGGWKQAQVRVECSLSPNRPPLHSLPALPLSSSHLHSHPLSSWHLERAQPCRGRGTLSHPHPHHCPLSPGSLLCSGSRCQRDVGTTGGCGRKCLGPSGSGPQGHIGIYAGQQTPRARALIVSSLSQCQPDGHCLSPSSPATLGIQTASTGKGEMRGRGGEQQTGREGG